MYDTTSENKAVSSSATCGHALPDLALAVRDTNADKEYTASSGNAGYIPQHAGLAKIVLDTSVACCYSSELIQNPHSPDAVGANRLNPKLTG